MNLFFKNFGLRVRRRETPCYDRLYRIAKYLRQMSIPVFRPLHSMLYTEWCMRTSLWHNFWRVVYYEPMFKSQCHTVGKNFCMEYAGNGSTKIFGNLQITLGDNVRIFDNTCFVGLKVIDNPLLIVGNNTYLGPRVRFMVGKRIEIGNHCLIGSMMVTDNPGHPIDDVLARLQSGGGSPSPESIRPVKIGDFCFLPAETVVYPGVTIGDGVVARVGTHINKDVPSFCQIGGNPMRIMKKLPIPDELRKIVGEGRYNDYLEVHRGL